MNDKERFENGLRFYRLKRFDQALREFESVKREPSEDPDLAYYIGLCYTHVGKYDDALLYLEQVVTLHTNLILIYQVRMVLSYIYNITRRFKLAEFELNQLLEMGYESVQVYTSLSYSYYFQGRIKESLDVLNKALDLNPQNTTALNSIGYIMADKEIDIPQSLAYCKKAVRSAPENAAYLDSLGWAHFKAGELDEAKNVIKKALNLSKGHKIIMLHLREILEKEPKTS